MASVYAASAYSPAQLNEVHLVNIVTLPNGTKWMLDVGFGVTELPNPSLIPEHITLNLGTQEIRLIHSTIPQQVDQSPASKLWIYQYRNGPEKEWNSFFAFPEFEFLHQDFEIINHFTSTSMSATNFQTKTVLIVRFLRGEGEESESIIGKVMLVNGEVKRNIGGKTNVVTVCETEKERVEAIEKYFAITLTEEEIEGIKGRNVELIGP